MLAFELVSNWRGIDENEIRDKINDARNNQ